MGEPETPKGWSALPDFCVVGLMPDLGPVGRPAVCMIEKAGLEEVLGDLTGELAAEVLGGRFLICGELSFKGFSGIWLIFGLFNPV